MGYCMTGSSKNCMDMRHKQNNSFSWDKKGELSFC